MDIQAKVLAFLESQNPVPGADVTAKLACYYLDAGVIDSVGIVTMITEFEDQFGIRFENDDLQSDEFQTIGGLIAIIQRRKNGAA
ncbi:MAG: acyl carrier protein [Rhodospirillaceae bacterium]|nr:acyl carrier protein [Rhodospirillaceae bacterium]